MGIGQKIKKLRRENNLSQKELARQLFVTDKTISSWEVERTEPDINALCSLSKIFNCNLSYLINDEIKRNDIETEIKIELRLKEYLDLKILLTNRTKLIAEIKQIDTYFKPLKNKNTYLRIRNVGNKNIVTYKEKQKNYCDELEAEIDDAKNMEKIFERLGLKKIGVVAKSRIIYNYQDKYEIALDNVKNVGYFIEIEIKKYELAKDEEYQKLLQVAKDFGLNLKNKSTKHYLDYILERRQK